MQLFLNKKVVLPKELNRICADSETVDAVGSGIAGGAASIYGCAALDIATGIGGIACHVVLSALASKLANPLIGAFTKCKKTPVSNTCLYRGNTQEDYEKGDCYKEGYTCEGSCSIDREIELPETDLGNKLLVGGAVLEEFEINYNELEKDKAVFYVLVQGIPTRFHHLKDINKYEGVSKQARDLLLPEFE